MADGIDVAAVAVGQVGDSRLRFAGWLAGQLWRQGRCLCRMEVCLNLFQVSAHRGNELWWVLVDEG